MEHVTKDAELRKLGNRVLKQEQFRWIKDTGVKVGFALSDHDKHKDDKLIFAECVKVTPLYKAFIPYDFIIVFYGPNADMMSDKAREILMEHELMHIGLSPAGDLKIAPHDIEDFRAILDKYGMDWQVTA